MAVYSHEEIKRSAVFQVAADMANAARTAPKARGVDRLMICVADGDVLGLLADRMAQMHAEGRAAAHFVRDGDNLRQSLACVLIGTEATPMPWGCDTCGMSTCLNRQKGDVGALCAYATHDLGLAVGSAVSLAADRRIDNRVMFSIGMAAIELGMLPGARMAMGIPLSVSGKSPYYDRK